LRVVRLDGSEYAFYNLRVNRDRFPQPRRLVFRPVERFSGPLDPFSIDGERAGNMMGMALRKTLLVEEFT